jgi:hypothetical protein
MEKLNKKFDEEVGSVKYKISPKPDGIVCSDKIFHLELDTDDQKKVRKEVGLDENEKCIVTYDFPFKELIVEYDINATLRFGKRAHIHLTNENLFELYRVIDDIIDVYNLRNDQIEYFQCQKCGAIIELDQAPYDEPKIIYPTECYEHQGGCGRTGKLLRLKKEYVEKRKQNRKTTQ